MDLGILILVVLIIVLVIGVRAIRRITGVVRRAQAESKRVDEGTRCGNCGYDLQGLNFPRCPECGALRGFRVSVDDLELTEGEQRQIDERCRGATALQDKSED